MMLNTGDRYDCLVCQRTNSPGIFAVLFVDTGDSEPDGITHDRKLS